MQWQFSALFRASKPWCVCEEPLQLQSITDWHVVVYLLLSIFFLIERKKDVPKHGPHAYVYLVRRHCYGHRSICFVCTCPVLYVRSIDLVGVVKPVGVSSRFKYA